MKDSMRCTNPRNRKWSLSSPLHWRRIQLERRLLGNDRRDPGHVFCDTGKVSTKEERLDWPVTDEERNSDKGWGRFGKEQICRLKIRRMKEELAKDLVVRPWCISEIVNAHETARTSSYSGGVHKPVVIQDQVLGELTLDKDYDTFEGEIQWCGKDVSLSLEVNAESKPSWTRARSAAKKLLADCDTWTRPCGSLRQRT